MSTNPFYSNIKQRFGFGCMRLPMKEGKVDHELMNQMVDYFLDHDFNYFDTAHGYVQGMSETALRDSLTSRYPRDSYILTNKLSVHFFNKEEQIRPLFESQLEACGVDYFDFYLMHAQSADIYEHFKRCNAYKIALELKKEGKIKHFGISFHDTADVLEKILMENPEIEVVQIQLNYIDFEDVAVQSKKCYEVCKKYKKPVIVMEPCKGGNLVNLPDECKEVYDSLNNGSYASYAIRFAASLDQVMMVLSGMGNMEMMEDNLSYMKDFKPINDVEKEAIDKVISIFNSKELIPCTACRYCMEECPKQISIPDLFSCLNKKNIFHNWNEDYYYNVVYTSEGRKAKDCLKCGKCEKVCPQHLKIRELLVEVSKEFDH